MKTLQRNEALKLWNLWWREMKEEWFKIEVLQDYSGEDRGVSLDAWLAGDREKSIQLMGKDEGGREWIKMCKKSPARKRRFHIVEQPHTPYLEWEIELYKRINIPLADEEVFLVPKEKVTHLTIPDGDVMVWDSKRVIRNHYTIEGLVKSMEFYEEDDDIHYFFKLQEELSQYAIPLKQHLVVGS